MGMNILSKKDEPFVNFQNWIGIDIKEIKKLEGINYQNI